MHGSFGILDLWFNICIRNLTPYLLFIIIINLDWLYCNISFLIVFGNNDPILILQYYWNKLDWKINIFLIKKYKNILI